MADKKSIGKAIVTAVVVCGVAAGGFAAVKKLGGKQSTRSEKVFVQRVAAVNSINGGNLFASNFAGVIVAQKTVDVKYDTSKTVDEVLVSEGDSVKKGQKLLTYSVEEIQLEIDSANLEIERMENAIASNNNEIAQLEQEKKTATGDAQVSYTTQILALQSENNRSEYDIKTKRVELQKLENTLKNAYVTAPIDGTVKSLKDPGNANNMYMENADVLMTIAADGNYRVKGVFNEQNSSKIHKDAPVILKSRVDDTEWKGKISEIDTSPQQSNGYNMYDYGYNDEQTSSSKYVFYVEPESLDGFMLGQHILIEVGSEAETASVTKEGIWLYSDFVMWDGDRNYVWAKTGRDRIEKRFVEVGNVDSASGDCQILSGLDNEDYIAYPAEYIEEGMATTTNQSDKNIPENTNFYSNNGDTFDLGDYVDENVTIGEDGMEYTDGEGNDYTFDENGKLVEGDTGLESEDGKDSTDEEAGTEDAAPEKDEE